MRRGRHQGTKERLRAKVRAEGRTLFPVFAPPYLKKRSRFGVGRALPLSRPTLFTNLPTTRQRRSARVAGALWTKAVPTI
jgi:hypothetical protein